MCIVLKPPFELDEMGFILIQSAPHVSQLKAGRLQAEKSNALPLRKPPLQ
jgi:hypothetical protein